MKDSRRVGDWGGEVGKQRGGGESGWWKPPAGSRSWVPTVPAWEKRFCTAVCGIPWKKICETKRVMSFYSNVVDWDDSAGKEAFEKAKSRFYAEINGLPCQIALPGPDLFIDEVNWNAEIDPQLVLELEKDLIPREVDQTAQRSGVLSLGWDRPIPCSGWEDAEGGGATALAGGNGGAVRGWESSEERGGGGAAGGWDHQKNSNWDGYNSGWGAAKAQESWWLQDSVRNDLPGHYSELKSEPKMREGVGQYYLSSATFHHRRDDPHQPAKAHRRSSRRWKAPPQ
ncbi:unnamed protein product [Spirodela intermedia]|uniref:Uncharacterized protein n=1 Tax=Spirodela intermedia TaxID=51605 RepID=A0A7I8L781_SPIIN|nr:unnamed protein product [Spirodela intermedia]